MWEIRTVIGTNIHVPTWPISYLVIAAVLHLPIQVSRLLQQKMLPSENEIAWVGFYILTGRGDRESYKPNGSFVTEVVDFISGYDNEQNTKSFPKRDDLQVDRSLNDAKDTFAVHNGIAFIIDTRSMSMPLLTEARCCSDQDRERLLEEKRSLTFSFFGDLFDSRSVRKDRIDTMISGICDRE